MTARDLSVLRTPQLEKLKKLLYPLRDNTERLDVFYKILVEEVARRDREEWYE